MPVSIKGTRASEVFLFTKIIAGANQHLTAPFLLGGQSTTPAQLVAVFTGAIQASSDLDAAKAVYQQKLAARDAAFTTAHAMEESLRSYVMGAYGKTNPVVTDFGFSVAKKVVKSVKVKADAIVKSAATRLARHTMGPKQKETVHGVVGAADTTPPATTGVVITPPSQGSVPGK